MPVTAKFSLSADVVAPIASLSVPKVLASLPCAPAHVEQLYTAVGIVAMSGAVQESKGRMSARLHVASSGHTSGLPKKTSRPNTFVLACAVDR